MAVFWGFCGFLGFLLAHLMPNMLPHRRAYAQA